jgi:hypothetical protein
MFYHEAATRLDSAVSHIMATESRSRVILGNVEFWHEDGELCYSPKIGKWNVPALEAALANRLRMINS